MTRQTYFRLILGSFMLMAVVFCLQTGKASAVTAADWKAGRIIDDSVFFNRNALSVQQIQTFLDAKVPSCDINGTGSTSRWNSAAGRNYTRAEWGALNGNPAPFTCLRHYVENPATGQNNYSNPGAGVPGGLSAAQIIYNAAYDYGINPAVLLVTLQKEQSLITDDWPYRTQYDHATGAFCPDTPSGCDPAYNGFARQVRESARLFIYYKNNINQFNFNVGNNYILWNVVTTGCGGGNVFIENIATAMLYIYTPYQPNTAALNNMYGTGDGCSAYGNRNFWRLFNDWFGSTRGNVMAVKTPNNATVYLRDGHTLRPIPSMSVLEAWGFSTISTIEDSTFNALTVVSPNLSRVVQTTGSSDYYFIDGGRHYYVPSAMYNLWGLGNYTAVSLPPTTVQATVGSGQLGAVIYSDGTGSSRYLIDGNQKHPVSSLNAMVAWTNASTISTRVSDTFMNELSTGATISHNRISNSGNHYLIDGGRRYSLGGGLSDMYPLTSIAIGNNLLGILPDSGSAGHILRSPNGSIYLVENQELLPIGSMSIFTSWGGGSYLNLSQSAIDLLPKGSLLSTNVMDEEGDYYIMNGGAKRPIPAELEGAYDTSSALEVSAGLTARISTGTAVTGFIKSPANGTIYWMDNGTKRPIAAYTHYLLLNGARNEALTILDDATVNLIPTGSLATPYVTNGDTNYLFDNGNYYSVATNVAAAWGLANPGSVAASTLSRYTSSGALTTKIKYGGTYGLVAGRTIHKTGNTNMASLWGLSDGTTKVITADAASIIAQANLHQFARKSDNAADSTIFMLDNDVLYPISSMSQLFNYGFNGGLTYLPEATINAMVSGQLARPISSNSGKYYVFDNGVKREIVNSASWLAAGNSNVQPASNAFMALLPAGSSVKRAIRTTDGSIYAMDAGKKRGIGSYAVYVTDFGSEGYSDISWSLANVLPFGANY